MRLETPYVQREGCRGVLRVIRPGAKGMAYRTQGFTLIEILVAVSILAICLVVILQLFSGALKSSRVSDEYTTGIFYAREKMEEILLTQGLTSGVQEGEFDDAYRWRAKIVRIEQAEEEASKIPVDTFQITVDVTWGTDAMGKGKQFQLSTLKVVEKQEMKSSDAPKNEEAEG
ncbi:MAG: prepilin-type N-terminal cleavage/methylation domain-containing protein [Deltaproteobacteria bacterium]|nr:prepilin-type N-terminal cleavage/methylation domain-containing protein [Deltaproteobacteria bacterium]